MKKKTQVIVLIDDLRNPDLKTRLASVQSLKDIASALGPLRTRTQFIQYLQEFVDDDSQVVDELLKQLSNFKTELGGEEHEKNLLPILISFCKTDEPEQTQKALSIMQPILQRNKDLILDTVKKLSKTEMNTSKQAAAYLISKLIHLVPNQQNQLTEIFKGFFTCYVLAYKIIASKLLGELLSRVKNKEEGGKILELIYNDVDDLPKMFALDALINYYQVDSVLVANKLKALLAANNWRINAKICDVIPNCAKTFSKSAFKVTFQTSILKFLAFSDPQLRAKACSLFKVLALGMVEEEMKSNLIPLVKKLASDPVDFVRIAVSENIVQLIQIMSGSLINQDLLPIIFTLITSNDLAMGVLKNLQVLTKKFPPQVIEQKILTPIINQLKATDWKRKCLMIDHITGIFNNTGFLNDQLITVLVRLTGDRISAVREKVAKWIVSILSKQTSQWCDTMFIPKIQFLKGNSSYMEKQIMLEIIEKTYEKVSQKTLNQVYKATVVSYLSDKVPNVRARTLKVLRNSKILNDKTYEKYNKQVEKLRSDSDAEVKRLAWEVEKMFV